MYEYLLAWAPIWLSLVAVVVSLYALRATANQFASSARPYAWIENHAYLDSNGQPINQPSTFQVICENAPAKLVYIEYKFFRILAQGEKELLHEFRKDDSVVFPSGKTQYTYGWGAFPETLRSLSAGEKLERETRIAYQHLSSKRTYFYERKSLIGSDDGHWRTTFEQAT